MYLNNAPNAKATVSMGTYTKKKKLLNKSNIHTQLVLQMQKMKYNCILLMQHGYVVLCTIYVCEYKICIRHPHEILYSSEAIYSSTPTEETFCSSLAKKLHHFFYQLHSRPFLLSSTEQYTCLRILLQTIEAKNSSPIFQTSKGPALVHIRLLKLFRPI